MRLIPEDGRLTIELVGDLAALLNLASGNKKPVTRDRNGPRVTLCGGTQLAALALSTRSGALGSRQARRIGLMRNCWDTETLIEWAYDAALFAPCSDPREQVTAFLNV